MNALVVIILVALICIVMPIVATIFIGRNR